MLVKSFSSNNGSLIIPKPKSVKTTHPHLMLYFLEGLDFILVIFLNEVNDKYFYE